MKRFAIFLAAAAIGVILMLAMAADYHSSPIRRLSKLNDWPLVEWVEAPDLATRIPAKRGGVVNGEWVTGSNVAARIYDGVGTRAASGAYDGTSYSVFAGSNGAVAYSETYGTKAIVTYDEASNTIAFQDTVAQAGSGATGIFLYDHVAAAGSRQAVFMVSSGTFNSSDVITADTAPNGTITANAVTQTASLKFLEKATTVDVASVAVCGWMDGGLIGEWNFANCGAITGAPLGGKTLLLVAPYQSSAATISRIYYNIPENDDQWREVVATISNSIRHFHALHWAPGVGANDGTLYVLCGDTNNESSILICEDVADLIDDAINNSGADWETNWAFDQASSAAKAAFLMTGAGADYCAGAGDQIYRAVNLTPNAASAATYLYYLPDTQTASTAYLCRLDTSTNTAAKIGKLQFTGSGWYGIRQSDGKILLTTASEFNVSYQGTSDAYAHFYALTDDGLDVVEVAKYLRGDSASPSSIFAIRSLGEIDNYIYAQFNDSAGNQMVAGRLEQMPSPSGGRVAAGNYNYANSIGGSSINYAPSASAYNGTFDPWATTNCTVARETTLVQAGLGASLKVTPNAGAANTYVSWVLPNGYGGIFRGTWVTLSCWVLADFTETDQPVQIQITTTDGSTADGLTAGSASWQRLFVSHFVEQDSAVTFYLTARGSGSEVNPVYFSDISITPGANRPAAPRTPIYRTPPGHRTIIADGWYVDDVPINQTNQLLSRDAMSSTAEAGYANGYVVSRGGTLERLVINTTTNKTAGVLTAEIYKNGARSYIIATMATGADTAWNHALNYGTNMIVVSGDVLTVVYTTDGSFTPAASAGLYASVELTQ